MNFIAKTFKGGKLIDEPMDIDGCVALEFDTPTGPLQVSISVDGHLRVDGRRILQITPVYSSAVILKEEA